MLTALIVISALSILAGSVRAEGNLSCQAVISTNNHGVAENAQYQFTINNTGTATLGDANITIPAGYSNIKNLAVTQQPASQTWTITQVRQLHYSLRLH